MDVNKIQDGQRVRYKGLEYTVVYVRSCGKVALRRKVGMETVSTFAWASELEAVLDDRSEIVKDKTERSL